MQIEKLNKLVGQERIPEVHRCLLRDCTIVIHRFSSVLMNTESQLWKQRTGNSLRTFISLCCMSLTLSSLSCRLSLCLSLSILQVSLTLELLFYTSFISELASVPRRYAQYVPIHQLLYHTLMPLRLKQE